MENQKVTFIEFLTSILRLFIEQKKVVIISFVIALAAAIFVYFSTNKTYEASFSVSSDLISETSFKNRFQSLDDLITKTSATATSERLGISLEAAKALNKVECEFSAEESTSILDQSEDHSILAEFNVLSTSQDYFVIYQKAIIDYISGGPTIQEKVLETRSSMLSLQQRYEAFLNDSSNLQGLNISVEGIPSEKAYVAQQLERIKIQLNNFQSLKLVSEIIEPEKSTNKNLIRAGGVFVLINLLGVFLAILSQAWPQRN